MDTPSKQRADRRQSTRWKRSAASSKPIRSAICRSASLRKAVADDNHEYCYACYTGNYPTELVNIEELIAARQKRH